MNYKIIYVIIGILMVGLFTGCVEQQTDDNTPSTEVELGSIDFQVTDKVTTDFSHVNVTFSEIRLFNQTENDSSYIVAVSNPKTVDLISLNLSDMNASLGIAEIEAGNYSKLWLNVTKCIGILNETGEQVNITVPSGWLKIQQLHLFNIEKGNNTILVDIDLEDSIHSFHGGQEYKFIPVISRLEFKHEHKIQFREQNKSKIKNMVGNRKPVIDLVINDTIVKNKISLDVNTSYTFNASASIDLDGDTLNYSWDFGDGSNATGSVVNHTYDVENTYQLWLTVSDGTDTASYHVVVQVGNKGKGNNGND
jgi:hypothetical protein